MRARVVFPHVHASSPPPLFIHTHKCMFLCGDEITGYTTLLPSFLMALVLLLPVLSW